jgi:hypothetical protein
VDRLPVRRAKLTLVTVSLALALAGADARADPLGELQKAYSAYVAQRYDEAEARLRALLDPQTGALKDPGMMADARMYLGAALVAEHRKQEAEIVFEQLLLEQPEYSEDPLRVRQDAIDAFIDVRTRLHDRLAQTVEQSVKQAALERARQEAEQRKAALRVAMLEQLASEEIVVERHSRWVALLPFGVGQFQNGQTALGATFLGAEALCAAGSLAGAALALYNENQIPGAEARDNETAPKYRARAETAALVGDALAGGFLFTALVGAIHAEASFVPQRVEIHTRAIPPLSLAPVFGPGTIAIVGSF